MISQLLFTSEAAVIRHNGLYSVHCVRIALQKHNGFSPPQNFCKFVYTMHSISVLGKNPKVDFSQILDLFIPKIYD